MIPFRDYNPSGSIPFVTIALVVLNAAAFLHEVNLEPRERKAFIEQYGVRPLLITAYVQGHPKTEGHFAAIFLPLLTAMFLHGGWLHLIGNMWFLWIFGDNIEDRMGHSKYLIFYLLCGLGATLAHILSEPTAHQPMVGASGAIAGVLGAYAVAFPRARVSTLVPIFFLFTIIELPALVVLGFWFLIQFLSGMQSLRMQAAGGVAWWAHIGGFVLGIGLLFLFQKPRHKRRPYRYR